MALYVIERRFAEQLEIADDDVKLLEAINAEEGIRWLFSFLSADHLSTYCLYEAPSADAIAAAARRANPLLTPSSRWNPSRSVRRAAHSSGQQDRPAASSM